MPNNLQEQVNKLQADLSDLVNEVYSNNFSASQDFNKYSRFRTRLQVPTLATTPTVGAIGDIICVAGKLRVCTVASNTAPTWTIVGTQS